MERRINNVSLIGIFFLVLGIALLLHKLEIIPSLWIYVFWGSIGLYGLGITVTTFPQQRRSPVFWGSLMFFFSIGVILHRANVLQSESWDFLATLSLAISFACLMTYLLDIRRMGILIPAILCGAYGLLHYLWEYELLDWYDIQYIVRTYWPVLLIVWGISFLVRRRTN